MKSQFNRLTILILLILGITLLPQVSKAQNYRVEFVSELASSLDPEFLHELNKVKNKNTYVLPNGSKIYFTNKRFSSFEDAKNELEKMLAKGFKTARIRLFHYQKGSSENDIV